MKNNKISIAEQFVAWKNRLERILNQLIKKEVKQKNIFKVYLLNLLIFLFKLVYQILRIPYQILRGLSFQLKDTYTFLQLKDTKNYCKKNKLEYKVIYPEKETIVYPPNFWSQSKRDLIIQEPRKVLQPEIYIAELNNVCIYAGSNITKKGMIGILDKINSPYIQDFNLIEANIRHLITNNIALCTRPHNKKTINIDKGIMLSGGASYNYYHWFTEFLPRMSLVTMFDKYNNYPILIDYEASKINSIMDSFQVFNKKNREIIILEEKIEYRVNHLVKPSLLTWMAMNLKSNIPLKAEYCIISEECVTSLREAFLPTNLNTPFRKIYISRKSKTRKLLNENIIIETIEKYGFEIVYPEELSLAEQIKLFSECKVLIGSSGAGITNLLFMQKNTTAICFMADKWDFSYFSNIAGIIGINLINIIGKKIKNNNLDIHSDLTVDQNEVENVINYVQSVK